MLYPQLNLIPSFNDPNWFSDYSTNGGTMVVDPSNPHKMTLTIAASAQGRLIWIPVELGKTYTISFKTCAGLYRLYKRKVGNHDIAMVLVQDATPVQFTFTVDASFQGFVTLRLTQGYAGSFVFENFQLQEGTTATPFRPYSLGNAKPTLPRDVVAQTMTGSTHKPTNGNVFSVLKDVKVKTAKINVMETGDFNVAIYEWEDGVGIKGTPLIKVDKTYTATGVYTIDFRGTLLRAGKKYWIGRYILSGQAGVMRALGYDVGKLEFVSWLGGSDYTGTTVVYPTTYYYFFNLELERPRQRDAVLVPNNLFDADKTTYGYFIDDTTGELKTSGSGASVTDYTPVKGGKTYTFENMPATFKLIMRFAWYAADKTYIGGSNYYTASNVPKDVTAPSNAAYIRFTIVSSDFQKVLFYEKNKPVSPKATLTPTKNFIEPLNEWGQDADITVNYIERKADRVVFDITTSTQYKGIRMPIKWDRLRHLLGKRVTMSAKTFNKTNANNSQIQLRFTGGGANTDMVLNMGSLVTTKDVPTYHTGGFLVVQMNTAGTARIELEGLQLEIGDGKTPYKPLMMGNRPAVLVPEGNLLPPLTDPRWFTKLNQLVGEVKGDYEFKMTTAAVAVVGKDIVLKLDPTKTYTVGATVIGSGARLRVMRQKDEFFQINVNPSNPIQTFTPISGDITIRLENNGQAGDYTTKDFFLYEGNIANPVFKPQKLLNPKL